MSQRKSIVLRVVLVLCAALLAIVAAGASYRPNTKIPAGFRGRHVMMADLPNLVIREGQGPNMMFIHASPATF